MTKKLFFKKIISGLINQRFEIDEEQFNDSMYSFDQDFYQDQSILSKTLLSYTESVRNKRDTADYVSFCNDFRELTKIGGRLLSLYKFEGGYLSIVGVIDADNKSIRECENISNEFSLTLKNKLRNHASSQLIGFSEQKCGTYGCLIYVFNNSQQANEFLNNGRSNCSHSFFLKQTYCRAWVIDTEAKKVYPHSGIPIYNKYVITASELENYLFQTNN